jgi:hypothetical protein
MVVSIVMGNGYFFKNELFDYLIYFCIWFIEKYFQFHEIHLMWKEDKNRVRIWVRISGKMKISSVDNTK